MCSYNLIHKFTAWIPVNLAKSTGKVNQDTGTNPGYLGQECQIPNNSGIIEGINYERALYYILAWVKNILDPGIRP